MSTTRTLNPLPFQDLEPHRFEDLVRQLAYDFRAWKSIEATGRMGSDEGMDIRAWERVEGGSSEEPEEGEDSNDSSPEPATPSEGRLWVFQCKREQKIGPAKVRKILEDFFKGEARPYGYVFAAAADFSKATRDAAADLLRKNGVSEFQLWGRGELEDLLIQPKNDNILFAYFGISLQVRRRSVRTIARSKLALKRKLVKELGAIQGTHGRPVLIRDPQEEDYPWVGSVKEFVRAPKWRYWEFHSHEPPDHVQFVTRRFLAFVNWETGEWDFTKEYNDAHSTYPPVHGLDHTDWDPDEKALICRAYWELHVPEQNRAYAVEVGIIEYDRILLCDELGDHYNPGPHLLVDYVDSRPFKGFGRWIESAAADSSRRLWTPEEVKRLSFFPKSIPDERDQHRAEIIRRSQERQKKTP